MRVRHFVGAVLLTACSSGTPAESAAIRPPACSAELLDELDPGSPVASRKRLPPMTQELGALTVHLAVVGCETEETDEACIRRGRDEVAKAYPPPAELHAELIREPKSWRVDLSVDGRRGEVSFASAAAAEAHIAEQTAAGRRVEVHALEGVPGPDSRRSVHVRADAPKEEASVTVLRTEVELAPQDSELAAMLRLYASARKLGVSLQSYSAARGKLTVVLSCRAQR